MTMADKFPAPYKNDVPKNPENAAQMEYVHFPTLGIGARNSGLPKAASAGPKALDHVGSDATKSGK